MALTQNIKSKDTRVSINVHIKRQNDFNHGMPVGAIWAGLNILQTADTTLWWVYIKQNEKQKTCTEQQFWKQNCLSDKRGPRREERLVQAYRKGMECKMSELTNKTQTNNLTKKLRWRTHWTPVLSTKNRKHSYIGCRLIKIGPLWEKMSPCLLSVTARVCWACAHCILRFLLPERSEIQLDVITL